MCENNISEKVATKIVGENWFNFMKTQFQFLLLIYEADNKLIITIKAPAI